MRAAEQLLIAAKRGAPIASDVALAASHLEPHAGERHGMDAVPG